VREEPRQRVLLDRLYFAAQLCQRLAPDLPQNLRIAPLAMKTTGTEATFKYAALGGKVAQCIFHGDGIERKTVRSFAQSEGAVRACEAANEFENRVRDRLKQRHS